MRYNDILNGTNVIDEVIPKYKAAWEKKSGFLGKNGLFKRCYAVNQDETFEARDIGHTIWFAVQASTKYLS